MRKIFHFLLILLLLATNNLLGQEVLKSEFKYKIINEDFSSKEHDFPIVRENENYFIIDENEYLIIRENNDSEYAIILDESLTENSYLKTSLRLGPSKNDNSSIGIISRANNNFSQALVIEINKEGRYRIKQLDNSNYIYFTGNKKRHGWVRNKAINKEDEYNTLEIIDRKDKIIIKINNHFICEFKSDLTQKGYSGILIGPDTKARIKYFNLNSDKTKDTKIEITQENLKNTNKKSKNEFSDLDYKFDIDQEYLEKLGKSLEEGIDSLETKIEEQEKIIKNLKSKNSKIDNSNTIKDLKIKLEAVKNQLKTKEEEQEKIILSLKKDLDKNNTSSQQINELNKQIKEKDQEILSLNTKLADSKHNDKYEKESEKIIKLEREIKKQKLKNESNIIELAKLKTDHNKIKLENSKFSSLINQLNSEISEQKETNTYLKEIFVYKDFKLNGVNPSEIKITKAKETTTKEIIKKIINTDSKYTIQMGVFMNNNNRFYDLENINIVIVNQTYKYFYGNFDELNDASEALQKLKKQGYKNILITKKSNK